MFSSTSRRSVNTSSISQKSIIEDESCLKDSLGEDEGFDNCKKLEAFEELRDSGMDLVFLYFSFLY